MKQTFWNPTKTVKNLHKKPGTKTGLFQYSNELGHLIAKR